MLHVLGELLEIVTCKDMLLHFFFLFDEMTEMSLTGIFPSIVR